MTMIEEERPIFNDGVLVSRLADVGLSVKIGEGTKVWPFATIMSHAVIGKDCMIGRYAYIDEYAVLEDGVRVQNGAMIYRPCHIGPNVFIGPGVIVANDRHPRIGSSWNPRYQEPALIEEGASIGAGAIILPSIHIGRFAVVGAGAVVTHNVPEREIVKGVPARSMHTRARW
jgi:UDP-2-acetamido-3-amino-2,3-dideoxy-glucuronate N-acetyltransferase